MDTIEFKEGFALSGRGPAGRAPVGGDPIQVQVISGTWSMPTAESPSSINAATDITIRKITAGKDGAFTLRGRGSSYIATSVDVATDRVMVLEASGDGMVYVNGAPRAGDPYSNGYLKLPVVLHKGQNTFLFNVARGTLHAKLTAPRGPIQIETGDLTVPDTAKIQTVHVTAKNSAGGTATSSAVIQPMTLRKIPINLPVPDGDLGKEQKFDIEADGDKTSLTLAVRQKNETHSETFISDIDGSLQYFGVNPSQKPKKSDALILSLHGAGVEAIGQARAYSNKDWSTLVAATNRRPYGFDWEDIGRLDGLEVLEVAKKRFPHDPANIHLTGHSMGGHGTWALGTLYPDMFASIAPSAGWISFWSYGGGFQPQSPTKVDSMLMRSMAPGDTLARVDNTLEEKVYILHGAADDNVPVGQARQMKQVLTSIHADFGYHEEPGVSHWWDTHIPGRGASCVDWPGIFDQIQTSRLTVRNDIDFTTPSPAVSSHDEWVTVLEQTMPLIPSVVKIDGATGTTKNVAALRLDKAFDSLTLDGQNLGKISKASELVQKDGKWSIGRLADGMKSPDNSGPFKNVYRNRFMFVVGTHGTAEENKWAAEKARFDAESFQYRGNGSVDIVTDSQYRSDTQRNVLLYGNAETNSAWKSLLGNCPIQVTRSQVSVGSKSISGSDLGGLFVYPHKARGKWMLVGAITGTGLVGCRATDRLGVFTSGVAYPDWTILSGTDLTKGTAAVKACGFFNNDWTLSADDSVWNQ